jgi:hypothetical protein
LASHSGANGSGLTGLLGTWTVGSDSIEVWAGAAFAFSRRPRVRLRQGLSSPLG